MHICMRVSIIMIRIQHFCCLPCSQHRSLSLDSAESVADFFVYQPLSPTSVFSAWQQSDTSVMKVRSGYSKIPLSCSLISKILQLALRPYHSTPLQPSLILSLTAVTAAGVGSSGRWVSAPAGSLPLLFPVSGRLFPWVTQTLFFTFFRSLLRYHLVREDLFEDHLV